MGALKSKNNKAPSQSIQTSLPKFERTPSQSGTDLGSEEEDIQETPPPGQRPPPFAPFPINDPDNFNLLQEEYRQTLNFQGNENIDTTNNNNNHKTKASHKNNNNSSNIHASNNKVWWRLTHAQKNNANASSMRKSGNGNGAGPGPGNGTTNNESENSRNRMGNIMDDRLTPDKNSHFGSPPQQGAVVAATVRHAPQYGAPLRGVSVPDPRHAHTTHNHHHRHQHHHRTPSRSRDRDTKRGQANGSRRHMSSSRSKSKEDKNRLIYAWLEQNEKVNKVLSKRGGTKPAIAHPVLWEAPDSSSSGNSRSVTAIGATVVDANVEESDPSNSRENKASRRSHKVVPVPITNLNTANADLNPLTDSKKQSDLVSPHPHPHPPTPHSSSLQRNEPFLSISPLFTDRDKKKLLTVHGQGRDPKSRSRSRSKSRLSRDPNRDRNRNRDLIPAAPPADDDDEETEEGTGLRRSSKGASSNSNSAKPNKRPKTKNGNRTMRERIFQVLNDKDKYYGKLRTRERERDRDRDRVRQGTSRRLGRDKEKEREDDSFREEERGRGHLDKPTKKQSSKSRHRDRDRDFDESRRRHRNSPNRLIYEKEYKHGSKNTKRKNPPQTNNNGKGRSTDRDRDRRFSRHPSHHHRGNKKSRLQVLQVRESGQFKIKNQQKTHKLDQEQEQTVIPRPTESDQDRLRVEGETRRNILDVALKKEINEQQSLHLKKPAPPPPPPQPPLPPPDPQINTSVSVRDEPGTSSSPPKVTITLAAQQDTPNNTRSSLSYVRTPPGTGTVASLNKKLPKKRMWSTSPPPPEPRPAPDTKNSSGHNADPRTGTADQVEDEDDNDEEDAEDENENDDDDDDENNFADPISPPPSLPGISKPRARSPTQDPAPVSMSLPLPAALNLKLAPSSPDLIDILEQEKKSDYHENPPTINMNNSHRTSQHGDGFPSNNNNRDPYLSNDQDHRQRRYRGDAVANALDLKIDFSLIKTSIQRKEDRRLRFKKNNLFKFSKNSAQDFEADKNKNVIVYKADMDHDDGRNTNNNKGKVSLHRTKNATDFLNSSRGCHPLPPPDEAVTLPSPPPLVVATKELLENQALENRLRSVAFKLTAFMETQKQTDTKASKLKPFHPDASPTAALLAVRDESNRRQVNSGGDFENQRVTRPDLLNQSKIQNGQKKEPTRGENPPNPRAPAQNGSKLSGCYLDPKKFSKLLTLQLEKLRDKQAIADAEAESDKIKNSERDFKKIKNATEKASRELASLKTLPEFSSHVPAELKTILKRAQDNSLGHPANPTTSKIRVKNSGAEESPPPRDESGGDRKSGHGKRVKRLRRHRKTHFGKDSHKNIRSGKKKHRHQGHNHHHHSRHHHHHHRHHDHENCQHRRSKSKLNTTSVLHNSAQASDTDASSRRKKSPAVKIIADPSSTMFTISSKIGEPNGKPSPADASHGLPKVKGFGGKGGGGGGGRGKGGKYSPDNESEYSESEEEGGYEGYPYGGRDTVEDYYGSSGGYDGSQGYEDSFEDDSTTQTVTKTKSTAPADDVPKMTTTEAGGICFKLPGRVTHKTTIKVAHFPRMPGDNGASSAPAAPAAPAADGPICINLPGSCWDPCTCWEQPCRGCGGGGCSHCRGSGCCPNPCCRNLYCPAPCCPGQGGSEPSKQLNNCNVYNFGDPENYCTANVNPLNPNPFGCGNLCDK